MPPLVASGMFCTTFKTAKTSKLTKKPENAPKTHFSTFDQRMSGTNPQIAPPDCARTSTPVDVLYTPSDRRLVAVPPPCGLRDVLYNQRPTRRLAPTRQNPPVRRRPHRAARQPQLADRTQVHTMRRRRPPPARCPARADRPGPAPPRRIRRRPHPPPRHHLEPAGQGPRPGPSRRQQRRRNTDRVGWITHLPAPHPRPSWPPTPVQKYWCSTRSRHWQTTSCMRWRRAADTIGQSPPLYSRSPARPPCASAKQNARPGVHVLNDYGHLQRLASSHRNHS